MRPVGGAVGNADTERNDYRRNRHADTAFSRVENRFGTSHCHGHQLYICVHFLLYRRNIRIPGDSGRGIDWRHCGRSARTVRGVLDKNNYACGLRERRYRNRFFSAFGRSVFFRRGTSAPLRIGFLEPLRCLPVYYFMFLPGLSGNSFPFCLD